MRHWIVLCLNRRSIMSDSGRTHKARAGEFEANVQRVSPAERVILLVEFSTKALILLTALQIAFLVTMHDWNEEIFALMSGVIGLITGLLTGSRL